MLKMASLVAVIGVAACMSSSTGALAHPELQSAEPAAGATVKTSPKQIRVTSNENVLPQFSGVEVKDQLEK